MVRGRLEGRVISLEQVRSDRGERAGTEREAFSYAWLKQAAAGGPNLADAGRQDAESRAAALIEYLDIGGGGDEAA